MYILGIDTTNDQGKICLYNKKTNEIFIKNLVDRQVSVNLINEISELLKELRTSLSQVDLFVVNTGPGSFTGLRVGIAVAKGLASSRNKPLIGISLFESMRILTQEISSQKKIYLAKYLGKKGICWQTNLVEDESAKNVEINLTSLEDFVKNIDSDSVVFFEDFEKFEDIFADKSNFKKIASDNVLMLMCKLADSFEKDRIGNSVLPIYI